MAAPKKKQAKDTKGPRPTSAVGRAFVLDRTGAAVLRLLSEYSVSLRQDEIAGITSISRTTLRPWLRRLEDECLISLPFGARSGYAITEAGRQRIAKLPAALFRLWGFNW